MNQAPTSYTHEPEFSVKQLFKDRWQDVKHVLSYKKSLAAVLTMGVLIGSLTAWLWTPTYTARLTFVIDDSKSGSMGGGLASLAGQFGVDIGGLGGGSGVLAGDNVQELVKSQSLVKATLLTPYDSHQTLADRYAAVNKLSKKWLKYSPDGKAIRFSLNGTNSTRLQDSLLHEMIKLILSGEFGIAKTDKKLDFFEINTTMKDEKLALLFCNRILKHATDFYIETKTRRLRSNITRLQHRADSVGRILNRKTYSVSSANQSLLDLNPAYTAPSANIEVRERDKILLTTIYSETVKNLEASKTMLSQETPTVQIVDQPEFPLKKNRLKYSVSILTGFIISGSIFSLYVIAFRKRNATTKEETKTQQIIS